MKKFCKGINIPIEVWLFLCRIDFTPQLMHMHKKYRTDSKDFFLQIKNGKKPEKIT